MLTTAAALLVLSGVVALVLSLSGGPQRLLLGVVAAGSGGLGLLLLALAPGQRKEPPDRRIWEEPYGPPVEGGDAVGENAASAPRPLEERTTEELRDA